VSCLCLKNFADDYSVPERIQLAPLRLEPFDHESPSSVAMQRQHSVSSATDSGLSSYYGSSSDSPAHTPCGSPQLGRSNTRTRARYHPYSPSAELSFDGIRCSSCLEYGEHVPVQLDQPCIKCGTISVEQRPTGKIARRKRNDRHLYSKLASGGAKPQGTRTKDQTEAGNRLDHTTLIGMHQHELMRLNPDLPTKARIGDGRTKLGWKALNPNNVSKDVAVPLTVNKDEVFISGKQVLTDTDETTESCRDHAHVKQQEAAQIFADPARAQTWASDPALAAYFEREASSNDAERIEESRRTRGTHAFRVPFGPKSKL
jgi:hypothetical protein